MRERIFQQDFVREIILLSLIIYPYSGFALNLTIGFVTTPQDHFPLSEELYNALQLAVTDVNSRQLLPNITLNTVFREIQSNETVQKVLDELIRPEVVTVFGAANLCDDIASELNSRKRIAILNASYFT